MHFYAMTAAGILAVVFAFLMLFQRSLYSSALCLMGALLQVAAIYFLLGAELLGWMQVLIYAGAVMVLIVIAVMVAEPRLSGLWAPLKRPGLIAAGMAALALGLLGLRLSSSTSAPMVHASGALEQEMASLLFGRFALMTETVGLIILLASLAALLPMPERKP